jgi:cyclopropane fatty-acyl-phospholipid synthase-like methyltransferase
MTAVPAPLLEAATRPYRRAGLFAYHFARGKLQGDPVFSKILQLGLLSGRTRVLDLGCGQGLLSAVLRAAEHCSTTGTWPSSWAAAPRAVSTAGIELMLRDVERAHCALGADSEIVQGDIRTAAFGRADAVVILDVLHYLPRATQQQILQRVRAALPDQGLLLLRVGDAAGGLRFRYTQWTDRVAMLARGHGWVDLHCRPLTEWRQLLGDCGFDSTVLPMSQGTPFANVLIVARARQGAG